MQACVCDLCNSDSFKVFPKFVTGTQYKVVVCQQCGLVYTNPRWDDSEIDRFYNEDFDVDPGAAAANNSPKGNVNKKNKPPQSTSKPIGLSLITQHINPRGKKWLEIRFRTGSILKEVQALGAEIHGVDLFDNNVRSVSERLNCSMLYSASIYDLLAPVIERYDVISMMTIHVLAHAPSPTKLLREVCQRLVPGGILILDEKDITRIPSGVTIFPFRHPYGMAHYHHLTLNSTKAFVKKAGFEILSAEYSPRISSLQHFTIVAKKPEAQPASLTTSVKMADDPRKIYWYMVITYTRLHILRLLILVRAVQNRAKKALDLGRSK